MERLKEKYYDTEIDPRKISWSACISHRTPESKKNFCGRTFKTTDKINNCYVKNYFFFFHIFCCILNKKKIDQLKLIYKIIRKISAIHAVLRTLIGCIQCIVSIVHINVKKQENPHPKILIGNRLVLRCPVLEKRFIGIVKKLLKIQN
jgi:hypothetical protein